MGYILYDYFFFKGFISRLRMLYFFLSILITFKYDGKNIQLLLSIFIFYVFFKDISVF